MTQPKIRVMIAEDHELTRYGLVMALEEQGGFEITGEAENGHQIVRLVETTPPDIVLMDIGMPVLDGITATRALKQTHSQVKIIMLTSHQKPEEVYGAFSAGADGYCMKDIKIQRLCQVIEMVLEGAVWLDPAIAHLVLEGFTHTPEPHEGSHSKRKPHNMDLTDREREVLRLIVDGKSNKEIAQLLNFTTHTAKAHVANIIQKLAVDDRTQAAVKALKDGML